MPQINELSIGIIGGIILGGSMITFGLVLTAVAVYNRVTRKKVNKEIYEQKERSNGQHKGGSRGTF